jgi:hypothetical protein
MLCSATADESIWNSHTFHAHSVHLNSMVQPYLATLVGDAVYACYLQVQFIFWLFENIAQEDCIPFS